MRIGPFIEKESGGGVEQGLVSRYQQEYVLIRSFCEEITCNSLSLVYRCTSSIHKLLQAGRREGLTGAWLQQSGLNRVTIYSLQVVSLVCNGEMDLHVACFLG